MTFEISIVTKLYKTKLKKKKNCWYNNNNDINVFKQVVCVCKCNFSRHLSAGCGEIFF